MGYRVDFNELDTLYHKIEQKTGDWVENLGNINQMMSLMVGSGSMSGRGADSIKSYISTAHESIHVMLVNVLQAHRDNCLLYKRAYQDFVDEAVCAVIDEDELMEVRDNLRIRKLQTATVDSRVKSALTEISDIFYTYYENTESIENIYDEIEKKIEKIDNCVVETERKHVTSGFNETDAMIEQLSIYIRDLLAKNRTYKTEFNTDRLLLFGIGAAKDALTKSQNSKAETLQKAIENEQERKDLIQGKERVPKEDVTAMDWLVAEA
jgi:Bacillus transposase protein.